MGGQDKARDEDPAGTSAADTRAGGVDGDSDNGGPLLADDAPSDRPVAADAGAPWTTKRVPGWWPRGVAWAVTGALSFVVILRLYPLVDDFMLTLAISFFVALAFEPIVNRFARRGWRRGVTTILVIFVGLILGVLFIALFATAVVQQVVKLVENLPDWVAQAQTWIDHTFPNSNVDLAKYTQDFTSADSPVRRWATGLAGDAIGVLTSFLGSVFKMFTVFLFTFYMVAEGPRFRRTVCSLLPPARQRTVLFVWEVAIERTGGYIVSRGLLALLSAVISGAFYMIVGLQGALFLGIFTGLVSQFVPTIGTYLAGVVPVLVALFDVGPGTAVGIIIFIAIYQQIENYVWSPWITAKTVEIHPAVAFGSVMLGAALLGATGALIAIPVAATVQTIFSQVIYRRRYEVVTGAALLEEPEKAAKEARRNPLAYSLRQASQRHAEDVADAQRISEYTEQVMEAKRRRSTLPPPPDKPTIP